MYTEQDIDLLKLKGVSKEQIESQLENFKKGFPFLEIVSAARVGNGILKVDDNEEKSYLNKWDEFLQSHKTVTKFVPASGAASRMFKDLFSFYNSDENVPTTDFVKTFFGRIHEFAFFLPLDNLCELYGKSIVSCATKTGIKILKVCSDEGKTAPISPKIVAFP